MIKRKMCHRLVTKISVKRTASSIVTKKIMTKILEKIMPSIDKRKQKVDIFTKSITMFVLSSSVDLLWGGKYPKIKVCTGKYLDSQY